MLSKHCQESPTAELFHQPLQQRTNGLDNGDLENTDVGQMAIDVRHSQISHGARTIWPAAEIGHPVLKNPMKTMPGKVLVAEIGHSQISRLGVLKIADIPFKHLGSPSSCGLPVQKRVTLDKLCCCRLGFNLADVRSHGR